MADVKEYYVRCSHCSSKNKAPLKRLGQNPTCGKCKQPLFSVDSPLRSGSLIVPCKQCQTNNRVPVEKLAAGPRCGKCKAVIDAGSITQDRPSVLSDNNFAETVLASPLPFLVNFHSPNCGPCKLLNPTISKIAKDFQGRLGVGALNVDVNQYIPSLYRIGGTPALLLFRLGRELSRLEGYQSSATITNWIRPHAW